MAVTIMAGSDMAKAIFHKDVEIRSKQRNVAWSVKASPHPQSFPRECIEIAVERGVAKVVAPRRKTKPKTAEAKSEDTGE